MKKQFPVFLIAAVAFVAFASFFSAPNHTRTAPAVPHIPELSARIEEPPARQVSVTLPAGLQVIDDEAFEGTALQSVELPESLREIGDRAFAENKDLAVIRMPDSLDRIGEDILAGSDQAAMAVFADSEILGELQRTDYRFFVMTAFGEKRTNRSFVLMTGSTSQTEGFEQKGSVCPVAAKAKRTGRTGAELKGDLYKGTASIYRQSRYFP